MPKRLAVSEAGSGRASGGGLLLLQLHIYESLGTCWRRGLKTDVLFYHVPAEIDMHSLETGRDVVLSIIGAACGQVGGG